MKNVLKKIIVWVLTLEARLVLLKYAPRVVGVTGSVGKTTTKDAIAAVLGSAFYVRKSEKSYNSEIGVPLTILGCENAWGNPFAWLRNIIEGLLLIVLKNHYPRWLVVEIGADKPGDIGAIARWLKLDIAVLNRVGHTPVHVEFFPSREALVAEKKRIMEGLRDNGTLILNFDDPDIRALKEKSTWKTYTFGFEEGADIVASHDQILYDSHGEPQGISFKIDFGGSFVPVSLCGVVGRQHVYPILAGVAVAVSQNIDLVTVAEGFRQYAHAPGRMRTLEGLRGATIIDDSYNSSPVAAEEALRTLSDVTGEGRKIAVLGDMMELGKYSAAAHRAIGERAAAVATILVSVGVRARAMAEGAGEAGMPRAEIVSFDTAREAGEFLQKTIRTGDIVLIKGSQSMRMERAVEMVLAHPELKKTLLVRQDAEWQRR